MSYIVFARKYRPRLFDEIIGQGHITTTIKNAISQDRVAHSYIFSGPRGVGKTTTARIFAKALNCEKGPNAPEPCNSCPSCNEISQGVSLDILEIDGASNRGIEEIRNLRENVKFAPSKGRFKVYIIDEVHMLTAEAFNALLKTLEEPPPHVKFIFATTQVHKVPPTILSRCQRFDFRRITTKDILGNLKAITRDEKLNISEEALSLIARYADGSLRDGQVILDQIMSFTEKKAEASDVARMLGVVEEEIISRLADSIKTKDAAGALEIIDIFINEGRDTIQVVLSLIEYFRNLSVAKISEKADSLIDTGPDKIKRYQEEARRYTIEELLYIIYALSNTIDLIKKSNIARIPLEMTMIKLTKLGTAMPVKDIMERLNRVKADARVSPAPNIEAKPPIPAKTPAEMDEVLSSWTDVINHVKAKKISIASYLQEGYPVGLEDKTLSIGFPKELSFHKEMLESPENRRLIEEAAKEVLKIDIKVALLLVEPVKLPGRAVKTNAAQESFEAEGAGEREGVVKDEVDPLIKDAMDIFGADVNKDQSGGRKR